MDYVDKEICFYRSSAAVTRASINGEDADRYIFSSTSSGHVEVCKYSVYRTLDEEGVVFSSISDATDYVLTMILLGEIIPIRERV